MNFLKPSNKISPETVLVENGNRDGNTGPKTANNNVVVINGTSTENKNPTETSISIHSKFRSDRVWAENRHHVHSIFLVSALTSITIFCVLVYDFALDAINVVEVTSNRRCMRAVFENVSAYFNLLALFNIVLFQNETRCDLNIEVMEQDMEEENTDTISQLTRRVVFNCLAVLVGIAMGIVVCYRVKTMADCIGRYAHSLEKKTEELDQEKEKTDRLLYQMLPPSIAEQLKCRSKLLAESFDSTSVYFSDIVDFTFISANATPMQVVELLNTLYSTFDSRIDVYDVYKVETIGDAYMVASGVPHRNGTKVCVYGGGGGGPCVAGVVGSKMPRYCLFGDTINTTSRMETSSKPMSIHISKAMRDLLDVTGLFNIQARETKIDVKGKGLMETFWLLGRKDMQEKNDSMYRHPLHLLLSSSLSSSHQGHPPLFTFLLLILFLPSSSSLTSSAHIVSNASPSSSFSSSLHPSPPIINTPLPSSSSSSVVSSLPPPSYPFSSSLPLPAPIIGTILLSSSSSSFSSSSLLPSAPIINATFPSSSNSPSHTTTTTTTTTAKSSSSSSSSAVNPHHPTTAFPTPPPPNPATLISPSSPLYLTLAHTSTLTAPTSTSTTPTLPLLSSSVSSTSALTSTTSSVCSETTNPIISDVHSQNVREEQFLADAKDRSDEGVTNNVGVPSHVLEGQSTRDVMHTFETIPCHSQSTKDERHTSDTVPEGDSTQVSPYPSADMGSSSDR
ncbi:hypothetical protein ACOMHN_019750 [Nucella lapillus]